MSRSKKRTPAGTWCHCKSQKKGKKVSHRRFRRKARIVLLSNDETMLPIRQIEITDSWNLGGDGKTYYGYHPNEDWFMRIMRK